MNLRTDRLSSRKLLLFRGEVHKLYKVRYFTLAFSPICHKSHSSGTSWIFQSYSQKPAELQKRACTGRFQLFNTKSHRNYQEALFYSSALIKFQEPYPLGTVLTSRCCCSETSQLLVSLNFSYLSSSSFIKFLNQVPLLGMLSICFFPGP